MPTRLTFILAASPSRLLNRGARCLVLQDDLVLRGLDAASSVSPVDHAGVVAPLVAGHDRVIGAL
jgi:hypothetical protein